MSLFLFKANKTLVANDVDVKRLAREIRKTFDNPCMGKEESLDVTAKLLGAQSYFDLRKKAKDLDISTWDFNDVESFVQKNSVTNGAQFPSDLPCNFGSNWQQLAQDLVEQAIKACEPGKLEFVALVGGSGTGKTLLANHVCAKRGGKVVDVELSASMNTGGTYKSGSVLVYDRPANPPTSDRPSVFSLLSGGAPAKLTLKRYQDLRRIKQSLIPHDDADSLMGIRDWILDNTLVTLVVCFANYSQVEEALRSSYINFPLANIEQRAAVNWRRAHVVDLDSMKFSSLDGPGLINR